MNVRWIGFAGCLFAAVAAWFAPLSATPLSPAPGVSGRLAVGSPAFERILATHGTAVPTPSFARQTGLACSQCHTQFPELTALGRAFKLGAYTLRSGASVEAKAGDRTTLLLPSVPGLSFMVQTSYSATSGTLPGTRNGDVMLPDQLSLFLGGEITPRIGAFVQVTYDGVAGDLGLDNADIRFATDTKAFGHPLNWGVSLNNAPTVQDLWNSTPVWGFPYAASPVAPAPAASPLLAGSLAQEVAGLTAYGLWAERLYVEAGVYHAAPTGVSRPLDENAPGDVDGVAPYWRVAVQHSWTHDYAHVGAYGLSAHQLLGEAPAGATNRIRDVALDASWRHRFGAGAVLSTHATWIHETVDPGVVPPAPGSEDRTLNSYRLDATLFHRGWLGVTLAPFALTGTPAPVVYPAAPVDGSRTGSPDSGGVIGQVSVTPWLNTKLTAQYTAYTRFNGADSDYDGAGRGAADNNTVYVVLWLLF